MICLVPLTDPANVALPQQPLHQCLFPRAAGYRETFSLVTNPYKCIVGNVTFLGHSGQPVADIARYSNIGNGNAVNILEATSRWQHLAPTAPDTLPCFPFKSRDPFVLTGLLPDVMYTANAKEYGTKLVKQENGHSIRLISVPDFSTTGQVVLINLATKESRCMQISVDESMMESVMMDIDDEDENMGSQDSAKSESP